MGARTRVIHTRDICEREGDGERLGTRDTAGDGGGRWTGGDGGTRRENTVFPYRTGDTLKRGQGDGGDVEKEPGGRGNAHTGML